MAPAVLDEELDQQAQLFVGGRSDGGDHPNSRYAAHFRYSGIFPILIGAWVGRYPTHPRFADVQWASIPAGVSSPPRPRSEEHTSELQSLMRNSYAVFCLKKKKT